MSKDLPQFRLVLLLILTLVVAAPAAWAQDGAHVVVLGSSTAAGTGPSEPENAWVERYRAYLQEQHPAHRVTNLAVGGYTTYHLLPSGAAVPTGRPQPDPAHNVTRALALQPSALVVNLPSNDAARGYDTRVQMRNYDAILGAARQAGVPVWVTTTQPRDLDEAGRRIQTTMRDATSERFGEQAIDFWTGLARADGLVDPQYDSGDGIHLNDEAHRILFERVRDAGIERARPAGYAERLRRERFVDSLLARMTLEEKLGQLTQYRGEWSDTGPKVPAGGETEIAAGMVGSFLGVYGADYTGEMQRIAVEQSRLGIPLLFAHDVIHGFRTTFPVPLGETASWNVAAVERAARIAAVEAAAHGIHWTFAPMVDIARDPRWGRVVEGAGEDPYLGSVMAAARVRGFEGDDLRAPGTIMSTAKHFVAYGGAEGGRDYNTVDVSERTLREVYLPPFKAAVEAGTESVMGAFNEVAGVPMHAHEGLIDGLLREEWGWDGVFVSDYTGVMELMPHGVAADSAEAGMLALRAGVDVDMVSGIYLTLADEVRAGGLAEEEVDEAVRRVLREKYELGLFEDPYRYNDAARQEAATLTDEHVAFAREVARQSIVLLENDGTLPLARDAGTLAVIGPLAADARAPIGSWAAAGRAEDAVTVLDGLRQAVAPGTEVLYAEGVPTVESDDASGIETAARLAASADAVVLVVGEQQYMSAEAENRSELGLPGRQLELAQAVLATGTPATVVLMNGRPLAVPWLAEHAPAMIEAWYLGVQMGPAVADVLFGDYNPAGKLPVTFPRTVGQVPIYYAHKMTGRPPDPDNKYTSKYRDVEWTPLYPFGYGLSYTTFDYGDVQLSDTQMQAHDRLTASVTVTNTGGRAGHEVVQLYVRDRVGSVTRPVKQLRGFERIYLEPGRSRTVTFTIGPDDLGFYDQAMERVVEPGRFDVYIGTSSQDVQEASFEVVE